MSWCKNLQHILLPSNFCFERVVLPHIRYLYRIHSYSEIIMACPWRALQNFTKIGMKMTINIISAICRTQKLIVANNILLGVESWICFNIRVTSFFVSRSIGDQTIESQFLKQKLYCLNW